MVLEACRYFGHTRDYWWSTLTWPLHIELQLQLIENPPADRLVAAWLGYEAPSRTSFAGSDTEPSEVAVPELSEL